MQVQNTQIGIQLMNIIYHNNMKKILIGLFICLIPLAGYGQSVFKRGIKIGNNKTGSEIVLIDSATTQGTDVTFYNGATILNATNNNTVDLVDVGFIKSDTVTTLATKHDLLNVEGGGGVSGKFYYLTGNIDDTGFPDAGDSSLLHTNFIGKHLTVFREGQLQAQHIDNTEQDGFRFNNLTGELIFRPVFGAGEQVELWATNTIEWEALTAEGDAGAAESVLLDSLIAVWEFDETSGSTFNESVNNYDGTGYSVTPNQAGKLGVSVGINTSGAVVVPYNAGLATTGDRLSISVWFKLDVLPSVAGTSESLVTLWDNTYHITHRIYVFTDNKLWGQTTNTTESEYYVSSTATVTTGTWYHGVFVVDGTGRVLKIYLNNVATTGNAFSGTLHAFNGNITIGNQQNGYNQNVRGVVDQVVYSYQRYTVADVALLYNGGSGRAYPFNE